MLRKTSFSDVKVFSVSVCKIDSKTEEVTTWSSFPMYFLMFVNILCSITQLLDIPTVSFTSHRLLSRLTISNRDCIIPNNGSTSFRTASWFFYYLLASASSVSPIILENNGQCIYIQSDNRYNMWCGEPFAPMEEPSATFMHKDSENIFLNKGDFPRT